MTVLTFLLKDRGDVFGESRGLEVPKPGSAAVDNPEAPMQNKSASAPLAELRPILSLNPNFIIVVSSQSCAPQGRQATCRTVGSLCRSGARCQTSAGTMGDFSLHVCPSPESFAMTNTST